MRNPFSILFSLKENFERIKSGPTWSIPYFITSGGISLLTWLKSCWRGTSFVADFGVLAGAFISTSIFLFVLWSMLALLLYLSSTLFNPEGKNSYRSMFSLVSFCGVIFLIGEVVNSILLRFHIMKINSYILPNRFPIGLDLFLIGRHPSLPLAIFLYSINPIVIWYFTTLSLGLHNVAGMSKNSARLTVLSIWTIGIGSVALIASVLGGTTVGVRLR